jgi:hypothetical protein
VIPIGVAIWTPSLAPWLDSTYKTWTLDTPWDQYYKQGSSTICKTCKAHLTINLSMLVFISSIIFYNLAYTTQAWIGNFKTCAMQANICNAHSNTTYKLWACSPYLCASNFNWSPYNVISFVCSSYLSIFVNFSPPLSSMTTKGELKF